MHFQATVGFGFGLCLLFSVVWSRPQNSNPFEQLSLGAMNIAGNIAEAFQSGAAINRSMNFDNPLMSVHSKTVVGFGDAMRSPSDDDDSSEERRRRRRRRRHLNLHRVKREPCFWKMTATTTQSSADDDDVDARRRRALKRAANNASRSRVNSKTKKKLHRRRRQATPEAGGQQSIGLGDRIKGMWLSFVDNVVDVVQQVRQKISSTAGQTTALAAPPQMPAN
ncbi:uncharacterized protein LOC111519291 [Drosophila willistoni]|uniref:uncharacterized protein LOC111519291 n=1 Tax=Drosophila willistoni TaxID=7260 RepID=UPI00017D8C0F|nr:uncharacterized protein LOC111519291 [Drosophila willistoni]